MAAYARFQEPETVKPIRIDGYKAQRRLDEVEACTPDGVVFAVLQGGAVVEGVGVDDFRLIEIRMGKTFRIHQPDDTTPEPMRAIWDAFDARLRADAETVIDRIIFCNALDQ